MDISSPPKQYSFKKLDNTKEILVVTSKRIQNYLLSNINMPGIIFGFFKKDQITKIMIQTTTIIKILEADIILLNSIQKLSLELHELSLSGRYLSKLGTIKNIKNRLVLEQYTLRNIFSPLSEQTHIDKIINELPIIFETMSDNKKFLEKIKKHYESYRWLIEFDNKYYLSELKMKENEKINEKINGKKNSCISM